MQVVKVTLYDIFGYLVPGTVALFGGYLIARPVLSAVEPCWTAMSVTRWTALLLVAYLAGHFVQAIANFQGRIARKHTPERVLGTASHISPAILESARSRARSVVGLGTDVELAPQVLFEIMDHYLQQHGKTETRDILLYREGFYRGLAVALFSVAVGFFARAVGKATFLSLLGGRLHLAVGLSWSMGCLSGILTVLAHYRYRRFSQYVVNNALFSFLAIHKPTG